MKTRGTLWPSDSTISGCVSALWMTRPMRVRVSSSQSATSIASATSIMKPRVAGNGEQTMRTAASALAHIAAGAAPATSCRPSTDELMSVNAGPRSDLGRRELDRGAAPDQLHQLDDHERQAEGDQQLGHVAELVDAAQAVALEQRAEHADDERRDHQRRPEAGDLARSSTRCRRRACRSWRGRSSARPSC